MQQFALNSFRLTTIDVERVLVDFAKTAPQRLQSEAGRAEFAETWEGRLQATMATNKGPNIRKKEAADPT